MTRPAVIESVSIRTARVSDKTDWTFVSVRCSDDIVGVGEASLSGKASELKRREPDINLRLRGEPAVPNVLDATFPDSRTDGAVQRAVISAVEQALWDAQGMRYGLPVCDLLGGALRETVPLYANINRGIARRTPDGFAEVAASAVEQGFGFIKIAPFDGLGEGQVSDGDAFANGVARIAAVCDAVDGRAEVMVDCHWRFDEPTAARLLDEAAKLQLYWIECPIPETPAHLPALRRLRSMASELGVRLAGMEKATSIHDFAPYLAEGLYDVLMPDVKYIGGLTETRRLAAAAQAERIVISPHNPTGPIAHAASIHVSSTLPNLFRLEYQFNETPYFDRLIGGAIIHANGYAKVPHSPGLGVALDEAVLAEVELR